MGRMEREQGGAAILGAGNVLVLIVANMALAIGPVFVRMADTGPVASAFWRMTLVLPFLFVGARIFEAKLAIGKGTAIALALSAAFFAADLASWNIGLLQTKLANASLLGNMAAILFPMYGFLVMRALPTRMQALALILAIAGSGLLIGRSYEVSPDLFTGDMLCLAAGVFYTFSLIALDKTRAGPSQWSVLFWSTAFCTLPLLAIAMAMGEAIWPSDWTPLIAMALISQLMGQGLLIVAIWRLSPLIVGLGFLTQPIVSVVIGWAWYGEAMAMPDWIGATLVGLALVLVHRPELEKAA